MCGKRHERGRRKPKGNSSAPSLCRLEGESQLFHWTQHSPPSIHRATCYLLLFGRCDRNPRHSGSPCAVAPPLSHRSSSPFPFLADQAASPDFQLQIPLSSSTPIGFKTYLDLALQTERQPHFYCFQHQHMFARGTAESPPAHPDFGSNVSPRSAVKDAKSAPHLLVHFSLSSPADASLSGCSVAHAGFCRLPRCSHRNLEYSVQTHCPLVYEAASRVSTIHRSHSVANNDRCAAVYISLLRRFDSRDSRL